MNRFSFAVSVPQYSGKYNAQIIFYFDFLYRKCCSSVSTKSIRVKILLRNGYVIEYY